MEDGHPGDLGIPVPRTVSMNPGRDVGHAQIQHQSMMEMIVSATTCKTLRVSNNSVQVGLHMVFVTLLIKPRQQFNNKLEHLDRLFCKVFQVSRSM